MEEKKINRTGALTDTVNSMHNDTFEKGLNTILIHSYDVFNKTTT